MEHFLRLNPSSRDGQPMTGPVAEYLQSEAFRASVLQIQDDPRAMARLTLAMLANVALDPHAGKTVQDFVKYAGPVYALSKLTGTSDSIWFCLRFNRLTNFIGSFTLARNAPETALLIKAIQENLEGKLFQAAVIGRRMDAKQPKRFRRLQKLHSLAHSAVIAEASSDRYAKAFRGCREDDRSARELREELYERARAAGEAAYRPHRIRFDNRTEAVRNAAFGPEFQGSFYQILTDFAVRHIVQIPPAANVQSL